MITIMPSLANKGLCSIENTQDYNHGKTTVPSTQLVEKKAMFLVSKGLSLEKSGVRVWGSDSPVSEELST